MNYYRIEEICNADEFKCINGVSISDYEANSTCIPSGWKCDKLTDCTDDSDEKDCESPGTKNSIDFIYPCK
jgi:hypothetical protein